MRRLLRSQQEWKKYGEVCERLPNLLVESLQHQIKPNRPKSQSQLTIEHKEAIFSLSQINSNLLFQLHLDQQLQYRVWLQSLCYDLYSRKGDKSHQSSLEYFAEFFAYWCSGNTRTLAQLKELTPKTYAYFEGLSTAGLSWKIVKYERVLRLMNSLLKCNYKQAPTCSDCISGSCMHSILAQGGYLLRLNAIMFTI